MAAVSVSLNNVVLLLVLILVCVDLRRVAGLHYKEVKDEKLGHKRFENGEIVWGPVPERKYHGNTQDDGSGAWTTTVNFAKHILLTSTRAQSFPYDLIRRILRKEHSQSEIDDYETNILVSCGVGVVFICIILLSFLAYVLYKRRQKKKVIYAGEKPFLTGTKLNVALVTGIVTAVINLIFIVCILVVNAKLESGVNNLPKRIDNSMVDVTSYFNLTQQQYEFMTDESNTWFGRDVLTRDISSIGALIWQPGKRLFYPTVASSFKEMENIDKYTSDAVQALNGMVEIISEVNHGIGSIFRSNFSAAFYNLSFAVTDWTCIGCDGSCSGCKAIIAADIYPQVDFTRLPNLTSALDHLIDLTKESFNTSKRNPEEFFSGGISDILQDKLATNITNIQKRVDDFIGIVRLSTQDLIFPTGKSLYFDDLKEEFSKLQKRMDNGNKIRSGFTWLFTIVNVGVIVMVVVSVVGVMLKKHKHCRTLIIQQDDIFLIQRRLLLWGSIAGIILSISYICLAIAGFYIGANLERVFCQTSKDYAIVEKVLDVPDTIPNEPGYFMGSVVLGNGSFELKLSDILRKCEKGAAAYTTLKQNKLAPTLQYDLNIRQHMEGVDDVFDGMYTDLNNVSLVPPLLSPWLHNLIDTTSFETELFDEIFNMSAIKADLSSFVANLRHVANTPDTDGGPMNPAKNKLIQVADLLTSWTNVVTEVSNKKDILEDLYNEFHQTIFILKNKTKETINNLHRLDEGLWNNSAEYIKQGVSMYRADFKKMVPKFTAASLKWVNADIGLCKPLTDAYRSAVHGFCGGFSDFENAEWFLCGFTAVVLLMMTNISLVIYNSLIIDTTPNDEISNNFEKLFGTSKEQTDGVVEQTLSRAKSSMSRLSASLDVGKRDSTVTPSPCEN